MLLMYADDDVETRAARISFLTDLYLNMPDKGVSGFNFIIFVRHKQKCRTVLFCAKVVLVVPDEHCVSV